MTHDAIIIGAGLAGLRCADLLRVAGLDYILLDGGDAVGGRIRTDFVEGFQLDRGFQVVLTAYPELPRALGVAALDLRPFQAGALVRRGGTFHRIADPWRAPLTALSGLRSPIGTIGDKLRVARLRRHVVGRSVEALAAEPETTTLDALQHAGFTASMIEGFFKPFLGGVFLDPGLATSSRMFSFVFKMFSEGRACLPAAGMEALPRQLLKRLPPARVRLGVRAAGLEPGGVVLDTGEKIRARAIVVATDAVEAARLLGSRDVPEMQRVTCLYFGADAPPVKDPLLVLNGEGAGPINNLCVPSQIAPSYAPVGRSLVSVTVLGAFDDNERLRSAVRDQMTSWFGAGVSRWRHLRTYRIDRALPTQVPPAPSVPSRPVRAGIGRYVCGDHLETASIEGALVSGRRAAEAVLEDRA